MHTHSQPSSCLEQERKKLHVLVEKYGHLGHPEVIRQSMRLDELINGHPLSRKPDSKKPPK